MKNVVIRSLSGLVYIAVMVGAILLGRGWLATLLCLLAACGIYEYLRMNCDGKMPRFATTLDVGAGVMFQLAAYCYYNNQLHSAQVFVTIFIALVILRFISQLYVTGVNAVASLSRSLSSLLYVGLPIALVASLYYQLANAHIVLAILIFIWVNDTGAFCVGSLMGRHKLFERISPKKTWEGFFGGMLFCIGAAFLMRGCFPQYFELLSYWQMAVLSVIVSIFATFGDLIESMIKRTAGVKDSGNVMPGHGGILDRIDSLLLVIPVSAVYLVLIS